MDQIKSQMAQDIEKQREELFKKAMQKGHQSYIDLEKQKLQAINRQGKFFNNTHDPQMAILTCDNGMLPRNPRKVMKWNNLFNKVSKEQVQ